MRMRSAWIAGIMIFCFGMALAASALAADITIKYATANPPGSFHVVFAEKFKELAEKYSENKIQVNLFIGGQLGSEEDNVTQCSTGMIHMSTVAVNNITPSSPAVGFMTLPYIFPKIEDAYKLFKNPFMDEINKKMVSQANIRAVSWLAGGYRVLTNSKREVRTPADLKGLTIRVPKNAIMIETYKAWGVNPVPMAWTETFNALQQGVVDGQDNPHIVNASSKFYEIQKYITDIHYILWTGPLFVGERFYQSLPADMKKVVEKAAWEAAEFEWKWVNDEEAKAMKLCLDKGMKLVEPADGEKEWMEKARAIWPKFYEGMGGKEMVDQAMKIMAGK